MKKILFASLIMVLAVFAVLIVNDNGSVANDLSAEELSIRNAWDNELSDAEKDLTCLGYLIYTKREFMIQMTTEPNPMSAEKAEALYALMEDEC